MHDVALPLAWHKPTARRTTSLLEASGEGHLVTIAPTGAGKGVSALIPALLTWQGPAIVVDTKGEAYHVTHRYRESLGQKVYILDPFHTASKQSDSLNPLDLLGPDNPYVADDAAMIASLLATGMEKPSDPFWDERAQTLITGLILHFRQLFDTLDPDVGADLHSVRDELTHALSRRNLLQAELMSSAIPEVCAAGAVFGNESRVFNSILSTAQSHMGMIRSGPVAESLASSTIALDDILNGAPLTLYIVLPPDKLISHGRLLRLWIGVLLTIIARRRAIPPQSTLFLIDEAAQLGRLNALLTAVTLLRGYGVKTWSFWQDLGQIISLYGSQASTLLNNCSVQQFFAPASPAAALELELYLAGTSPVPLTALKRDDVLITRSGHRPRVFRRLDYRQDALFAGRFDANPFYRHQAAPPDPAPTTPQNVYAFPTQRRGELALDR